MKIEPVSLAACGLPGMDGSSFGLAIFLVLCVFAIMGVIGWFSIRNTYRFGFNGASWIIGLLVPVLFSACGFCIVGVSGVLAGAPLLIAYWIGRQNGVLKNLKPNAGRDDSLSAEGH